MRNEAGTGRQSRRGCQKYTTLCWQTFFDRLGEIITFYESWVKLCTKSRFDQRRAYAISGAWSWKMPFGVTSRMSSFVQKGGLQIWEQVAVHILVARFVWHCSVSKWNYAPFTWKQRRFDPVRYMTPPPLTSGIRCAEDDLTSWVWYKRGSRLKCFAITRSWSRERAVFCWRRISLNSAGSTEPLHARAKLGTFCSIHILFQFSVFLLKHDEWI